MSQITKKSKLPEISLKVGILIGMLLQFFGCTMREAGCLDPNAGNFDLEADKSCDDCCTYPLISLTLTQKWDTTNFRITDTFYDLNQQPFLIHDLRYFLTAWSWTSGTGQVYRVDSVETLCNESPFVFYPDILVIEPQRFSYPIGIIRTAPEIDSISFMLGHAQDLSCLDPENPVTPDAVTSASPLWNPDDAMLHAIRLIVDRNLADTLVDTFYLDVNQTFNIPFPYIMKKGENTSLPVTVNYAEWFRDADVHELTSWLESIMNGLEGSFSQTP